MTACLHSADYYCTRCLAAHWGVKSGHSVLKRLEDRGIPWQEGRCGLRLVLKRMLSEIEYEEAQAQRRAWKDRQQAEGRTIAV